ncbi:uncharacterized protein FFB20_15845 [Fusarium fujikuroi]|nr:uncharacterized protein FFB20_15845 [Fusarium fujikuroi]
MVKANRNPALYFQFIIHYNQCQRDKGALTLPDLHASITAFKVYFT